MSKRCPFMGLIYPHGCGAKPNIFYIYVRTDYEHCLRKLYKIVSKKLYNISLIMQIDDTHIKDIKINNNLFYLNIFLIYIYIYLHFYCLHKSKF